MPRISESYRWDISESINPFYELNYPDFIKHDYRCYGSIIIDCIFRYHPLINLTCQCAELPSLLRSILGDRLEVSRRRATHHSNFGRENQSRRPTPDEVNRALVRLVRAGAPQSLLWAEPEVIDLDELPDDSPLKQEIEKMEAEYQLRLARQAWLSDRISGAWLELKRLWREWSTHLPPLSRAGR